MSTSSFSVFFAVLTLACWAGTLVAWVLVVVHRRAPESSLGTLFDDLGATALWLAALVAVVTTAGSLYYSEVAHFVPCKLCWYQRIAMYPLSLTLLVAAIRRDARVWWYVVPPAVIGAGFAIYHAQLQAFPSQHSSFCTVTEPCTVRYVWEFGFISLPLMALSAFVFVLTYVVIARSPQELA
jgi:disulfide bond formation protein DsbB